MSAVFTVEQLLADMVAINNEQTNYLRQIAKAQVIRDRERQSGGAHLVEIARLNSELVSAQRALLKRNADLQYLNAQVERLAITDELTQVFNRRGFADLAQREIDRSARFSHPVSFALLDIDEFKTINDTFSHDAGDQMLVEVTHEFRRGVRDIDVVGRYGGDEIVLMFPETPLDAAAIVCERIRERIEYDVWVYDGDRRRSVTISVGVAELRSGEQLEHVLQRADNAMYLAKQRGRNQVVSAS